MKLTAPARRGGFATAKTQSPTTMPGYVNPNRQSVVRDTGAASRTRDRQSVYALRCGACAHEYGCNGLDVKARLCPKCQGGVAGEPLRETQQATLFG